MKVLKFGGKSLETGQALNNVLEIIRREKNSGPIAVVVSAVSNTSDLLLEAYKSARKGEGFPEVLRAIKHNHKTTERNQALEKSLRELEEKLEFLQEGDLSISCDDILAFGELSSSHYVVGELRKQQVHSVAIDARTFIKVDQSINDATVNIELSKKLSESIFSKFDFNSVPIITGFISSNRSDQTITLGRNGTNYSAALVADFLSAEELQNWTVVDGIYTAEPDLVPDARLINHMSFKEAQELANFGAGILHPRTIEPLVEKGINLRILNSLNPEGSGTLVSAKGGDNRIKAVSVLKDVALITIEGNGLLHKVGIDARIFRILGEHGISIRLISQASSERGVGFVIDKEDGKTASDLLYQEFEHDLEKGVVSSIKLNTEMTILAIVGRHNYSLEKAIYGLRRNGIWMHLISNSISGEHISLVIDKSNLNKAVNIVHSHVFGAITTINVFCLGKGEVGSNLINQILATKEEVVKNRRLKINVIGVADSQLYILNRSGVNEDWKNELAASKETNILDEIIQKVQDLHMENVIIADNTSSQEVADHYPAFLKAGFDIVASNKKLNSGAYSKYEEVRKIMKQKGRLFYYEANVGAGLPVIDTLKQLKDSAESIIRIRGIFSGSLSYLFNTFSELDRPFSEILLDAKEKGLTEADPREDLSGLDVARKLIVLSREVGLKTNLEDVQIENLIPSQLAHTDSFISFISESKILNEYYRLKRENLAREKVLRYIGDMDVNEQTLKVSLVEVDRDSPLGSLKGADSIFEVYTRDYGERPIVIQGAGAGGKVTARGVYSDLIRAGRAS
ncbi:MAG: bifunctional aspartate kinase/homoserine dehydrogenase I [Cyclobacteriaceae bacterium]